MAELVKSIIYIDGHPAGYTDDLGIISDVNQWVPETQSGWYVLMQYKHEINRIVEWCKFNLSGYWKYNDNLMIYMSDDDDATLFKLTWA